MDEAGGAARRPDRLTLAGFGAVVLLAGSNLVAVRFANRGMPPLYGAAVRFFLASLVLFGWVWWRKIPLPDRSQMPATLLFGVLGFAGFYAFGYWALVYLPAGVVGVLAASVPLLTILFAALHGLERVTARGLAGSLIALAGIAVLLGVPSAGALTLWPVLAVLAAAACDAEAAIAVKRLPTGHPVSTNAVAMLVGGAVLLALSALWRERWFVPTDSAVLGVLAYLVTLGSILLFVLFLWTIKRWTASGMSYMFVLMPVVGTVLGAWLLGEPVTAAGALGGLIVLAGVYVGALSGSRKRPVDATEAGAPA